MTPHPAITEQSALLPTKSFTLKMWSQGEAQARRGEGSLAPGRKSSSEWHC